MARYVLCAQCGEGLPEGQWVVRTGLPGENEVERIRWGLARQPKVEQRTIAITTDGVREETVLPLTHFNCDGCNGEIKPGERCCARTFSTVSRPMPEWEGEYLEG